MRLRSFVVASLVFSTCAAPPADAPDASSEAFDAGDTAHDAAQGPDANDVPDASELTDAGDLPDGGVDLTCVDTAAAAPAECQYLDLHRVLLKCDGDLTFAGGWLDYERTQCPEYWTLFGRRCGTLDQVIEQSGCDGRCRWRASISVSFLHCGWRNGYIVFRARGADGEPDPECPDKYEFADGWYESFEEWAGKHPCPDAGGE